jgi:LDH2 family malate/lactate/ureidoglycolate dehydrogenase
MNSRRASGIAIDDETWRKLEGTAKALGLTKT